MKSKLLLYFDDNIIVPVSCDADERSHETDVINYKAFTDLSYIELIREFYLKTTGTNRIDSHFIFAETIDEASRKRIIGDFTKEGFTPASFTAIPSIILTEYAMKQSASENASFGENVAVLYSDDNVLRMTGTVYDGTSWKWNAKCVNIPEVGDSPLKLSLVKCLINERDKHLGAIDERKMKREVEYQMQFADEWLSLYKTIASNEDLIVDFKFTFEDSSVKLRLAKRVIEQYYEQTLAPAISSICEYKEKTLNNSIKYVVLVGPAFEEDNFTSKVKNALECNDLSSVIPHSRLASAMGEYLKTCELSDNFSKFDQIYAAESKMYKSNTEWIQYAKALTNFNEELSRESTELSRHVTQDTKVLNSILDASNNYLKTSSFNDAREILGKTLFPTALTNNSLKACRLLLAKKENMESIFAKLKTVDGARILIKKIQDNTEKIRTEIEIAESHREAIKTLNEKINHCENHYEEYLDLKREMNRAQDYNTKKELIEKMRDITVEPLPELKLRPVDAEIKYSREKVKVGLFKKKDVVHITVRILHEETLPCDAVLNVSNEVLIKLTEEGERCEVFEIEKGSDSLSVDLDSSTSSLDFSKPIYCYLFVAKKVLDKRAITCDPLIIK